MIALMSIAALAYGDLPEAEEQSVLEHVLGCAECTTLLAKFAALGNEIKTVMSDGGATLATTPALLQALQRQALITREYVLAPGATVNCGVDSRDVYVATTLHTPILSGRIDVVMGAARFNDVPFDPRSETLTLVTSADVLRTLPSMTVPVQLMRVEATHEVVIAAYTLNHAAYAG